MSDSESDNAFESADEGDDIQNAHQVLSSKIAVNSVVEKSAQFVPDDVNNANEVEKCSATKFGEDLLSTESNNKDRVDNITKAEFLITPLTSTEPLKAEATRDDTLDEQRTLQPRVVLRLEKKLQDKTHKVDQKFTSESTTETVPEQHNFKGSWNWGDWGSSFISTAASSVSTFTSQVSHGLGTVLETVEATLGAPSPEELANTTINKQKGLKEIQDSNVHSETRTSELEGPSSKNKISEDSGSSSSLLSGVSSVTKVLETTGSKVILGGLDTLELIGKKTFDILTEGDPGLRKKRSIFTGGGTSLSQLLREAKEEAEICEDFGNKSINYKQLFDDFQGLIHLEALEMLSGECNTKLQGKLLNLSEPLVLKQRLDKIRQTCEDLVPEDDTPDEERDQDFESLATQYANALNLPVNIDKLMEVQKNAHEWLKECKISQDKRELKDPQEIHHQALSTLAEFTSRCIEQFHKIAEFMLVKEPECCSPETWAVNLSELAAVLCLEVSIISTKFCQCLNTAADDSEDPDTVTPLITNVYLEASNSNTYIQDAFLWLIPVLQLVVVKNH